MRSDRGLDRFITFIDAVVAIALTLLVLPLTDLIDGTHPPAHVSDVFTQNAPRFGAFLLSFVVIARLWLAHHRMTERVGSYDRAFVMVNLGWVLTVVFLPFATDLTSSYPSHDLIARAVYLGTLTVGSLFLLAAATLVWRRPTLRRDGLSAADVAPWTALGTSVVLLVAFVVGVLLPAVNYYALFLLFAAGPAERVIRRIARRAGPR